MAEDISSSGYLALRSSRMGCINVQNLSKIDSNSALQVRKHTVFRLTKFLLLSLAIFYFYIYGFTLLRSLSLKFTIRALYIQISMELHVKNKGVSIVTNEQVFHEGR